MEVIVVVMMVIAVLIALGVWGLAWPSYIVGAATGIAGTAILGRRDARDGQ